MYIACVVLPKDSAKFDGINIKDSKKFSSKNKINEVADYIKENALAWCVEYIDADVIDNIHILKSVMQGMHNCIRNTMVNIKNNIDTETSLNDFIAVVDGNYFTPYMVFNETTNIMTELNSTTVEQGDAKYMGIAAASILAKTSHDAYVIEMCDKYPLLEDYYGFRKNVGYGTKQHREGIIEHGITRWHRRTFGQACRNANIIDIPEKNDS